MAVPIFEETLTGQTQLGVAIFQFPVDRFKNVMSDRSGLGETGETYLVGNDLRLRSDSFLDPQNFSIEISFARGTIIDTAPVQAGLFGEAGVGVVKNYLNQYVLSAWSPFKFEKFNWVIVSEIAVSEVLNPRDVEGAEFYARFVELNQYYDLFLIHPDGEIFYTVAKDVDYQTNILSGPYSESNLGRVVRQAMSTESTSFIDFESYAPSGMAPAAFLVNPVLRASLQEENDWQEFIKTWSGVQEGEGNTQLLVALQLSDSTLNEVMLQRTGLGETGESYLVGPDFKLRTSTRDPNRNLSSSLSGEVALNGADTKPVRLALEGQSDTGLYQNYNGDWVLASFSPIEVHDQTWALITEIQASEVLRPVWILGLVVLLLLLGVVALVVQLALFFSRNITEPVSQTALALQTIAEEQDLTVQVEVEQEVLAEALLRVEAVRRDLRVVVARGDDAGEVLVAADVLEPGAQRAVVRGGVDGGRRALGQHRGDAVVAREAREFVRRRQLRARDQGRRAGVEQGLGPAQAVVPHAGRSGNFEPPLRILGGVGVILSLFDVFDRDQADAAEGVVDDQQLAVIARQIAPQAMPAQGIEEAQRHPGVAQALADAKPDAIFSSLFGPDLAKFVREGQTRGLFKGVEVFNIQGLRALARQLVELRFFVLRLNLQRSHALHRETPDLHAQQIVVAARRGGGARLLRGSALLRRARGAAHVQSRGDRSSSCRTGRSMRRSMRALPQIKVSSVYENPRQSYQSYIL